MGLEYTCVLDMFLLRKMGYSYIEAQSLYEHVRVQKWKDRAYLEG